MKLKKINLFYSDIVADNTWVNVSEQSYPILWNLLNNDNIDERNGKYETDIYEKIEDNNYTKHNELSPRSGNDTEHGGKR